MPHLASSTRKGGCNSPSCCLRHYRGSGYCRLQSCTSKLIRFVNFPFWIFAIELAVPNMLMPMMTHLPMMTHVALRSRMTVLILCASIIFCFIFIPKSSSWVLLRQPFQISMGIQLPECINTEEKQRKLAEEIATRYHPRKVVTSKLFQVQETVSVTLEVALKGEDAVIIQFRTVPLDITERLHSKATKKSCRSC